MSLLPLPLDPPQNFNLLEHLQQMPEGFRIPGENGDACDVLVHSQVHEEKDLCGAVRLGREPLLGRHT